MTLPKSLSDMHLIIWKFIIIHFTLVDLDRKTFDPDKVLAGALRRYASKANSLTHQVQLERKQAEADERLPNVKQFTDLIQPLGEVMMNGQIEWNPLFSRMLTAAQSGGGSS